MSGTSMASPHMAGILLLGDVGMDGAVSVRKRGTIYEYPIGIVGNGSSTPTNSAPNADAGQNQSVIHSDGNGYESVTLNGSNSSDPENDALTYSWSINGNEIGTGETYSHLFAVGSHTVTLTVSDGEYSDSDDVIISVTESTGSEAPSIGSAILTDASNPAWKKVSVDWTVNDNDGDLKTVAFEFLDPDNKTVDSATVPISGSSAGGIQELANKRGPSGAYTVVITVTDNADNSATNSYTKLLN